jgi:hypothetical protein
VKVVLAGAAAALLSLASPAAAQEPRDLCPERPGLGTPPCILDQGRVLIETGLADWTRDTSGGARIDTVLLADTVVRFGVSDRLELQLGLTPVGLVRERNGPEVRRQGRVGDATLAAKYGLLSPSGEGLSIAVDAVATLPTGRRPIGAGTWAGALLLPVSFDLAERVHLGLTPEIDAAADEDGHGRHLAYGSVAGLSFDLTESLGASAEVQVLRDRDPGGHATAALAGLSMGWQPAPDIQFDAGANLGLNRRTADVQLYVGIARRF